ncbi:MAG: hypothetical protein EPN85_07735 [Bacteroidetes bacterium]|nr:MAG: hypothetical protein EPN85_07735 [Bacteroidota bacterium]
MNILIRTDGSRELGNGHIVRMLALADQLLSHGIPFIFALKFDDFWVNRIREKKYKIVQLSAGSDHVAEFIGTLKEHKITHLVYDTRGDLSKDEMLVIKNEAKLKVIVIDSPEDTRLAADTVIFPPIPQLKEWSWDGFSGKVYSGWEYVFLRKEFSVKSNVSSSVETKKILLSFGSTDPFYLTEKMLTLVVSNPEIFNSYEFILLVGPQFNRLPSIKESADYKNLRISVVQAPEDIVFLFRSVDFAFIAFGVTAYELSALSVPFLCISPTPDHERSARIFEKNSLCVSLGLINNFAENFQRKMSLFFEDSTSIKKSIQEFRSRSTICDWPKIIEAIIKQYA